MKNKHITDEVLQLAYNASYTDLMQIWDGYGLSGNYPTRELHEWSFTEYLKFRDKLDGAQTKEWRNNYDQRMRDYKNLSKMIDTIVTHPEHKPENEAKELQLHRPHRHLKIKDVYYQLHELN